MKNTIPVFALLILGMILAGCPKPCTEANYIFAVNSQITPDLDSVQIGDTIFLISSFPTKLSDQSSGQIIDYSNSTGIGSTLAVSSLPLGDTIGKDAVFDFDYLSFNGRIYNNRSIPRPDGVQQLSYEELNGKYVLKVGLIPKKQGNYILGIGNGLSNGKKKNSNCEKASFNISIYNTNQHFYLIENWVPGITLDNYGKMHVYYFKVY